MKTIWDIGEAVTGSRNGAAFVANPESYGWYGPGFSGQPPSMEDEDARQYSEFMKEKYAELLENRKQNRLRQEQQWQIREAEWTLAEWSARVAVYEAQTRDMAKAGYSSGNLSRMLKRALANVERIKADPGKPKTEPDDEPVPVPQGIESTLTPGRG